MCHGRIVYALLNQNTFLLRWHDIKDTLRPTPPLQHHHSIHSPAPALGPGISCHLGDTPTPSTSSPTHTPQHVINLTLHPHADSEIDMVFARSTTDNSAQVHLSHSHIPLIVHHLRRLSSTLRPAVSHHLPLRVLYHHLLISARSSLIPRDRNLSITMYNNIHTMTPNDVQDPSTRLHYIHLFLNPSTGSPYLSYTLNGQPNDNPPLSSQQLTVTTSLPNSPPSTKRPQRHLMMCTTSHMGETITFPTDSVPHQITILTLVTHMLFSAPTLNTRLLSWGPVRQPNAHQQTLGIILATLPLKRYHPIWFTSGPPLIHTGHLANMTSAPHIPLIPSPTLDIASTCTATEIPLTRHHSGRRRRQHRPTVG